MNLQPSSITKSRSCRKDFRVSAVRQEDRIMPLNLKKSTLRLHRPLMRNLFLAELLWKIFRMLNHLLNCRKACQWTLNLLCGLDRILKRGKQNCGQLWLGMELRKRINKMNISNTFDQMLDQRNHLLWLELLIYLCLKLKMSLAEVRLHIQIYSNKTRIRNLFSKQN